MSREVTTRARLVAVDFLNRTLVFQGEGTRQYYAVRMRDVRSKHDLMEPFSRLVLSFDAFDNRKRLDCCPCGEPWAGVKLD
jgi:hypothetical protein